MNAADQLNAGMALARETVGRREDALASAHAAALVELADDVARRLRATPITAGAWNGQEPEALVAQLRRQVGTEWSARAHRRASRLLGAAFRQVMKALGRPLGVNFDLANPLLAGAFERLTSPATFEEGAWEAVRSSLQESHDAGRSIPEAAADLRTEAGISSPVRARAIARTELVAMVNAGGLAAARISKASKFKQWLATGDSRTRDTHRAAAGQVRPLDDTFTVGGYDLDYPGDLAAPAKERVNCRCTVLFVDDPAGFSGDQAPAALL